MRLEIRKIDSKLNIIDCLTNMLSEHRFQALTRHMGLHRPNDRKYESEESLERHKFVDDSVELSQMEPNKARLNSK